MTRTVVCGGVTLPACIHPDGCDEPAAPNVRVCRDHMPPMMTLAEVQARIDEFTVRRRGNGWAVEHWTGMLLPLPTELDHPWLGGMRTRGLWGPRWHAEACYAAYARGETPDASVLGSDGVEREATQSAVVQPTLLDDLEAA